MIFDTNIHEDGENFKRTAILSNANQSLIVFVQMFGA